MSKREKLTVTGPALGSGKQGEVFAGKMGARRVAVKLFDNPPGKARLRRYKLAVQRLRRAGLHVPDTRFIFHRDEWVQVMQPFTNAQGTRLKKKLPIEDTRAVLPQIVGHFTSLTHAGIFPNNDVFEFLPERSGGHTAVPMDFDCFTLTLKKQLLDAWGVTRHRYPEELYFRAAESLARAPFMHEALKREAVDSFFSQLAQRRLAAARNETERRRDSARIERAKARAERELF